MTLLVIKMITDDANYSVGRLPSANKPLIWEAEGGGGGGWRWGGPLCPLKGGHPSGCIFFFTISPMTIKFYFVGCETDLPHFCHSCRHLCSYVHPHTLRLLWGDQVSKFLPRKKNHRFPKIKLQPPRWIGLWWENILRQMDYVALLEKWRQEQELSSHSPPTT